MLKFSVLDSIYLVLRIYLSEGSTRIQSMKSLWLGIWVKHAYLCIFSFKTAIVSEEVVLLTWSSKVSLNSELRFKLLIDLVSNIEFKQFIFSLLSFKKTVLISPISSTTNYGLCKILGQNKNIVNILEFAIVKIYCISPAHCQWYNGRLCQMGALR